VGGGNNVILFQPIQITGKGNSERREYQSSLDYHVYQSAAIIRNLPTGGLFKHRQINNIEQN
jgi:hypothetical protein